MLLQFSTKFKFEKVTKKTTFLIKYELYEYVVMFFDFCNVFEIFQLYINETFYNYLNVFCFVYLNNVLIYNNIKKNILHMFVKFLINYMLQIFI